MADVSDGAKTHPYYSRGVFDSPYVLVLESEDIDNPANDGLPITRTAIQGRMYHQH